VASSKADREKGLPVCGSALLKTGETERVDSPIKQSELATPESWEPIVDLLEELELGSLETSKGSRRKLTLGVVALGSSLTLFVWSVTIAILQNDPPPNLVMLVCAAILFVVGGVFSLLGSTSAQFRWLNLKMQTLSTVLIRVVQVFLSLYLWVGACLLVFFIVYPGHLNSREMYIVAMLAFTLAIGCLCASLWNMSIPLKIVELRSAFGGQGLSVAFEVSILAAFSAVAVAGLSKFSLSWESVACALLLGLVGYWAYRWKKFEATNSAVIDVLDRVRNAARRVNGVSDPRDQVKNYEEFLDAYRELQIFLLSGTKHLRQNVTSFGLLTLCAIADSRRNVGAVASELVIGYKRIAASQAVLDMSDKRFAHGSAQVFDGILRMMNGGFYPQIARTYLKKARKGVVKSDLYHYLQYWSLRF